MNLFIKALLFTIPGVCVYFYSSLLLGLKVFDAEGVSHSYSMLLLASVIGAVFTLIGLGKHVQWRFWIVEFLSIPVLLIVVDLIATWLTLHPALKFLLFGFGISVIPFLADKFVTTEYEQEDFENTHF